MVMQICIHPRFFLSMVILSLSQFWLPWQVLVDKNIVGRSVLMKRSEWLKIDQNWKAQDQHMISRQQSWSVQPWGSKKNLFRKEPILKKYCCSNSSAKFWRMEPGPVVELCMITSSCGVSTGNWQISRFSTLCFYNSNSWRDD